MKNTEFINENPKKIEILAGEVTALKDILVDVTQQVRRIERRIDLALPEDSKAKSRKSPSDKNARATNPQTLSEAKVEQLISRLKEQIIAGQDIHSELRGMTVKYELTPIARYFGMTNTALPPKDELVPNIVTRIRQSVMVGENVRNMSRVAEDKPQYRGRNNARD